MGATLLQAVTGASGEARLRRGLSGFVAAPLALESPSRRSRRRWCGQALRHWQAAQGDRPRSRSRQAVQEAVRDRAGGNNGYG